MIWVVQHRRLWGDLGDILISGLARRETEGGPLLLERTGPFLPPLSIPYWGSEGNRVVLSDELRSSLEDSGFVGLHFGPVTLFRVVRLS